MRAVVTNVDFLADKLQIRFDIYLEEGEPHYDDYIIEGEDTPCNSHFVRVSPTSSASYIQKIMLEHIEKVGESWNNLDQAQSDFIGLEVNKTIIKEIEVEKAEL